MATSSITADEFLSDLSDLEDRVCDTWNELEETLQRLNDDHIRLTSVLNRYANLNDCVKRLGAAYNEDKSNTEHTNLPGQLTDSDDVEHRLALLHKEMNVIKENKLRVGSLWLRFLVGRVSMKVWDDAKKLQMKTEYHAFKYRTNFIFLFFPVIQLIWSRYFHSFSWVINQWHEIWLLYYYISLTTRELILKLNGSKLHYWWIIHHQISSVGALISVLLMRSAYDRYSFIFELLIWISLIVGVLQIFATKYQLRRHYVRLALGKDTGVDIALTESMLNEENAQSSLEFNILKIASYLVYLLELSVGLSIVVGVYWYDMQNGHQFDLFQFEAYLCGFCFVLLAIGNTYALYTRPSKYMMKSSSREGISQLAKQRRDSLKVQGKHKQT